jgi:EAL domain-containing protein (putative c-di-GMP-specific phosphodiesterase class I)
MQASESSVSDPSLYGADELIRNADIAMYQAKTEGKAKSKVFTPVMSKKIERSWKLENDLRRAIERNELTVAYQPQICPRSGRILGAEALLRWTGEDGQSISPVEFIPLAEKSNLILEIGEWVLRQSCKEAVKWTEFTGESANAVKISVNISGRQLLQPEFPGMLESIIRETGIDPRTLELELTESVLVDSLKRLPAVLADLSRLGTKLAIDDFGTGYSSMSYLRDLMPDVIKIDRSFITGVGRERSAGALAKGMIGLAHDLGLTVIAEGVEDNLQLSFLQRHDCDLVQGYLASRPIPATTLRELLRENRSLISTASPYTLAGATDSDHSPILVA